MNGLRPNTKLFEDLALIIVVNHKSIGILNLITSNLILSILIILSGLGFLNIIQKPQFFVGFTLNSPNSLLKTLIHDLNIIEHALGLFQKSNEIQRGSCVCFGGYSGSLQGGAWIYGELQTFGRNKLFRRLILHVVL